MMVYLREDFRKAWKGKDPFDAADALEGEIFRAVKTRRTLRFQLNGKSYFAKIHHGVGWGEIFKNILQLKMPVLGAENEWAALRRLKELGVDTMEPCAYGRRGKNPAKLDSFIITEDLIETESLEDFCRDWPRNPPPFALKKALVEKLAWVSRVMHENGMNHRDYYICHFLLDVSCGRENLDPDNLKASLIDLHRAQIRKKTPRRWAVKDVAGLYFSAMDIGLTHRDILRFVKVYADLPLRRALQERAGFWAAVKRKAERLYEKEHRNPKG
ncbi:lipopolysaccharide core heptose(I) kinase RfaP [Verrucomicrobia bacterium S94]|nr:lipopolysaccharide core heptose(I) kinase RfaP [Verrucomicrobia bacterium S94]